MTLRGERWRTWAVALGLVAAGLWAQRDLLAAIADRVYAQHLPGNDALLHVWAIAWGQHALAHQPWAPFDANIFFPYRGTLLYSDHLLGLAALLAPLRLATDNVVLVHNLAVLAAPALNALAMAWLAWDLTRDHAAAALAGLAYGFAPLRFTTDLHQIQMLAAWWPPLLLLAGPRALARPERRWAALAGTALLLQGSTGIYLTAFFLPFLALAHLVWLGRYPVREHRRGWARLAAAEALAVVLLVPSAWSYQAVQAGLGSSRSPVLNAILSLVPSALPAYLPALTFGPLFVLGLLAARRDTLASADRLLYGTMALGGIVLSFGPCITLPGGLGTIRGPYALLMPLPGFDALRAPGRMTHVALIGLAIVGAAGFAWLRRRLGRRASVAATIAVLAALAWECRPGRFPLVDAPAVHDLHRWIAAAPEVRAYAELPFGQSALAEQRFQYLSTATWKPLANGSMGIEPPLHAYLTRRLRRFPATETLHDLAAVGVTHVAVHWAGLAPDARAAVLAAAGAPAPVLRQRFRSPSAAVYALDLPPPPPPRPLGPALPREGWTVTASENPEDARLAIDDAPDTRWASWGAHERHLAAWWTAEPFIDRWWAFIRRQPTRLAIDLGAAHRVGAVSVRLRGSEPAIVPLLELETSGDGRRWTRAAAELVPHPDVRALVARPAAGDYAFAFDAPVVARHLRFAVHGLDWRVEDVAVHAADSTVAAGDVLESGQP